MWYRLEDYQGVTVCQRTGFMRSYTCEKCWNNQQVNKMFSTDNWEQQGQIHVLYYICLMSPVHLLHNARSQFTICEWWCWSLQPIKKSLHASRFYYISLNTCLLIFCTVNPHFPNKASYVTCSTSSAHSLSKNKSVEAISPQLFGIFPQSRPIVAASDEYAGIDGHWMSTVARYQPVSVTTDGEDVRGSDSPSGTNPTRFFTIQPDSILSSSTCDQFVMCHLQPTGI